MGDNLLKNPGFESGKFNKVDRWGSMTVPEGWQAFFVDKPGQRVPWDKNNESGIIAPEFKPIDHKPPYLDPPRVHSGNWATCWFAFWKVMDAGIYQQVQVTPGQQLRLTAWAHGWSNTGDPELPNAHDPKWSDGKDVGYNDFFQQADPAWPNKGSSPLDDAGRNMIFQVGIDPTGGTNAWASSVVWGPAAHIYNRYHQVPAAEATAQGNTVTVFLRARNLWGLQHNDAYWDDPVLEVVGGPQPQPGPLPQPEPQPKPQPQPQPTPVATGSKLGAHVLLMNGDTATFVQAGPAIVKFAGDWGSAPMAPAETFVLGRRVIVADEDAQWLYEHGFTPAQAVQRFLYGNENQVITYQANPTIKYWEGHNEPVFGDEAGLGWYAQFEIERMKAMAQIGLKCVIGNFATGTPPEHLWPAFLPACQAALQYDAVLGVHEYSCPYMWWMTGRYQMQEENNVDPRDPNRVEGWTTLRYRKVYRQYLEPAGLGKLRLAITEFGLDPGVHPRPNDAEAGAWRQCGSYWRKHRDDVNFNYDTFEFPPPPGVARYTNAAEFYFEQLKWIDREMQQDSYVIGATIFTYGNFGGPWADFDVTGSNGCAGLITDYVKQSKLAVPLPSVTPLPTDTLPTILPPVVEPQAIQLVVQPAVTPYGGLKLRASRDLEADTIEAVPAGTAVTVIEGPIIEGGGIWVCVRTSSGKEGWARQSSAVEVYLYPAG